METIVGREQLQQPKRNYTVKCNGRCSRRWLTSVEFARPRREKGGGGDAPRIGFPSFYGFPLASRFGAVACQFASLVRTGGIGPRWGNNKYIAMRQNYAGTWFGADSMIRWCFIFSERITVKSIRDILLRTVSPVSPDAGFFSPKSSVAGTLMQISDRFHRSRKYSSNIRSLLIDLGLLFLTQSSLAISTKTADKLAVHVFSRLVLPIPWHVQN